MNRLVVATALVLLVGSASLGGQAQDVVSVSTPLTPKARILQKLLYSEMTVRFDETPARDAFNFIRTALGINLVVRYSDDLVGFGIDPLYPVTLEISATPALDVLELVIEQCALIEECTWQLRGSFLEVGTKDRLAMPGAQEVRVYPIADMLFEPPHFEGAPSLRLNDQLGEWIVPSIDHLAYGYGNLPYQYGRPQRFRGRRGGVLNSGGLNFSRGAGGNQGSTQSPRSRGGGAGALELMELITAIVEPEQWESNGGIGATIVFEGNSLVVKAPDFIHRQIGGYPRVAPPSGSTAVDRAD